MFKWRENFSTNVEEIDNQHKKLFEIGARLYEVASINDECDRYDEIMAILDELTDYTVYHFSYEEKLLQDQNYPDYDVHKIEHDFFIKKLRRLEAGDHENNQSESLMKMVTFVADWISSHILKTDLQYSPYLNGKGVY